MVKWPPSLEVIGARVSERGLDEWTGRVVELPDEQAQFLRENRAGRIAPAQLATLRDEHSNRSLGFGPLTRLIPKDAKLGRDLAAGVVVPADLAARPDERTLRGTLLRVGLYGAIEFAGRVLFDGGSTNESNDSGSASGPGLTGIALFTVTGERIAFSLTQTLEKTVQELGLVRAYHLPESRRILSVEALELPTAAVRDPALVAAELARAREDEDWFAYHVAARNLPVEEEPASVVATGVVGRWHDGGSVHLTLAGDGTATADADGTVRNGTWSMPDERLFLTDIFVGETKAYAASHDGDSLELRGGFSRKRIRLRRVG